MQAMKQHGCWLFDAPHILASHGLVHTAHTHTHDHTQVHPSTNSLLSILLPHACAVPCRAEGVGATRHTEAPPAHQQKAARSRGLPNHTTTTGQPHPPPQQPKVCKAGKQGAPFSWYVRLSTMSTARRCTKTTTKAQGHVHVPCINKHSILGLTLVDTAHIYSSSSAHVEVCIVVSCARARYGACPNHTLQTKRNTHQHCEKLSWGCTNVLDWTPLADTRAHH